MEGKETWVRKMAAIKKPRESSNWGKRVSLILIMHWSHPEKTV